jgi:hypothetical protein
MLVNVPNLREDTLPLTTRIQVNSYKENLREAEDTKLLT